ncbi:MAG: sodium:solute symporter family protein [Pseudomonadota bacterium]
MLDLLIVLAFAAWAVASGLRARGQASRSLEEYFLAGRSLPGWKAGLSMAATQAAADTPLLVTGLVAAGGVFLLWRLWIYGLAFLLMGFVLAALWRRAGVLTDAELAEIRYSGKGALPLRVAKALYYGTLLNCVVLAMVLVAAMRICEVFLPWHAWLPPAAFDPVEAFVAWAGLDFAQGLAPLPPAAATANNVISVMVIVAFTALYSTTGGLRAVVNTDIGQWALIMIATAAYAWLAVDASGGLSAAVERIADALGEPRAEAQLSLLPGGEGVLGAMLTIVALQWLYQMNSDGTGYLAQRSMACRSDRDARIAALVFVWAQIVLRSLLWLAIAVGLLALDPLADASLAEREAMFVTGIDALLPAGLRGLMLVGLLAALASTVDTHLNWGASYWTNDIYLRLVSRAWLKREPRSRELVWVARASNLLILGVALAIMSRLGSIREAWEMSLLFGAGTGVVLVARWLWERVNVWAEFAAMAAGLAAAPLLLAFTDQEWLRLAVMAAVSTAAVVATALLAPRTDAAVLDAFYRRVRPPGFWRETALRVGDSPAAARGRLREGLAATLLAALTVYLVLGGAVDLMLRLPGEAAWPAWTAIAAGLLATPLWWRAAFGASIAPAMG